MKNPLILFIILSAAALCLPAVTNLSARFSRGKTFITFTEDGSAQSYNIYRSTGAISNITGMTPIANIPQNSGYDDRYGFYHVIEDEGTPLTPGTGLFVYTPGQNEQAFYAVTPVINSVENTQITSGENSLSSSVSEEFREWPGAVLREIKTSNARYIYFYWMDYSDWNHNYDYYGHMFSLGVRSSFEGQQNVPLVVRLHGAGTAGFSEPYPGSLSDKYIGLGLVDHSIIQWRGGSAQTWWYGFSDNYDGQDYYTPVAGDTIINYTQMRIISYVHSLKHETRFGIDTNRTYILGGSMGGSGTLLACFHHPEIWAAVRPSIAIINYDHYYGYNTTYPNSFFDGLFGKMDLNLTARNGINIYNWTDITWIAEQNPETDFPPILNTHGALDGGMNMRMHRHLYQTCAATRHAVYGRWFNVGHNYGTTGGDSVLSGTFLRFKKNELYPAITNATQNDNYGQFSSDTSHEPSTDNRVDSDSAGSMNCYIDWTSSLHDMGLADDDLVDNADSISITLKSERANTQADITLRRVQQFTIQAGYQYKWKNVDVSSGQITDSGAVTADQDGLVTVEQFPISRAGSRLIITPGGGAVDRLAGNVTGEYSAMLNVYPNPFSTSVGIALMQNANIKMQNAKLDIIDLQGRILHSAICNLQFSMGEPVHWNATNRPAGIYIVKINTDGKTLIRRVTLVR
jgi:predicted esterase